MASLSQSVDDLCASASISGSAALISGYKKELVNVVSLTARSKPRKTTRKRRSTSYAKILAKGPLYGLEMKDTRDKDILVETKLTALSTETLDALEIGCATPEVERRAAQTSPSDPSNPSPQMPDPLSPRAIIDEPKESARSTISPRPETVGHVLMHSFSSSSMSTISSEGILSQRSRFSSRLSVPFTSPSPPAPDSHSEQTFSSTHTSSTLSPLPMEKRNACSTKTSAASTIESTNTSISTITTASSAVSSASQSRASSMPTTPLGKQSPFTRTVTPVPRAFTIEGVHSYAHAASSAPNSSPISPVSLVFSPIPQVFPMHELPTPRLLPFEETPRSSPLLFQPSYSPMDTSGSAYTPLRASTPVTKSSSTSPTSVHAASAYSPPKRYLTKKSAACSPIPIQRNLLYELANLELQQFNMPSSLSITSIHTPDTAQFSPTCVTPNVLNFSRAATPTSSLPSHPSTAASSLSLSPSMSPSMSPFPHLQSPTKFAKVATLIAGASNKEALWDDTPLLFAHARGSGPYRWLDFANSNHLHASFVSNRRTIETSCSTESSFHEQEGCVSKNSMCIPSPGEIEALGYVSPLEPSVEGEDERKSLAYGIPQETGSHARERYAVLSNKKIMGKDQESTYPPSPPQTSPNIHQSPERPRSLFFPSDREEPRHTDPATQSHAKYTTYPHTINPPANAASTTAAAASGLLISSPLGNSHLNPLSPPSRQSPFPCDQDSFSKLLNDRSFLFDMPLQKDESELLLQPQSLGFVHPNTNTATTDAVHYLSPVANLSTVVNAASLSTQNVLARASRASSSFPAVAKASSIVATIASAHVEQVRRHTIGLRDKVYYVVQVVASLKAYVGMNGWLDEASARAKGRKSVPSKRRESNSQQKYLPPNQEQFVDANATVPSLPSQHLFSGITHDTVEVRWTDGPCIQEIVLYSIARSYSEWLKLYESLITKLQTAQKIYCMALNANDGTKKVGKGPKDKNDTIVASIASIDKKEPVSTSQHPITPTLASDCHPNDSPKLVPTSPAPLLSTDNSDFDLFTSPSKREGLFYETSPPLINTVDQQPVEAAPAATTSTLEPIALDGEWLPENFHLSTQALGEVSSQSGFEKATLQRLVLEAQNGHKIPIDNALERLLDFSFPPKTGFGAVFGSSYTKADPKVYYQQALRAPVRKDKRGMKTVNPLHPNNVIKARTSAFNTFLDLLFDTGLIHLPEVLSFLGCTASDL